MIICEISIYRTTTYNVKKYQLIQWHEKVWVDTEIWESINCTATTEIYEMIIDVIWNEKVWTETVIYENQIWERYPPNESATTEIMKWYWQKKKTMRVSSQPNESTSTSTCKIDPGEENLQAPDPQGEEHQINMGGGRKGAHRWCRAAIVMKQDAIHSGMRPTGAGRRPPSPAAVHGVAEGCRWRWRGGTGQRPLWSGPLATRGRGVRDATGGPRPRQSRRRSRKVAGHRVLEERVGALLA
jgi:hypothetical protein